MKKFYIKLMIMIIFIIFCSENIHSQNPACGNTEANHSKQTDVVDCSKSSNSWANIYKTKEHYTPSENIPIKTLHVNLNIWQRSDGTGNLSDIPEHKARLKQIIEWVNLKYENVNPNAIPPLSYNVDSYTDSKIRIVLDSIYFYQDPSSDSAYYYGGYGSQTYGHNILLDTYILNNFPERTKALNIHLTGSEWPGTGGYSDFGSIESFYRRNPDMADDPVHDWWFHQHWAHEIGHSFDLWHTYDLAPTWEQNCYLSYDDFLTDLYDITVPCSSGCDICLIEGDNNNLMGGANEGHITGLQMGIIHRSTMIRNLRNVNCNLRDHVTGLGSSPYEIVQDEIWDFSIKFYQDVIVKTGNTLTIQCEVQMVPNTKIVVEQGAKLIVDGGIITNEYYHNLAWLGIEVWGNSNAHQYPDANGNYMQGYVELKNGAIIENAWEAIQPWRPNGWTESGGIIVANDATFRNNRRAVQFMSYQNFDPVTGDPRPNQSYFSNCTFETNDDYEGLFGISPFHTFVSMWKVDGIEFLGCDFIDSRPDFQHQDPSEGVGILTIDANYSVLPRCLDILTTCWQCTQNNLDPSSFTGLNIGINSSQVNTLNTYVVDRADFINNLNGIVNEANHFASCLRSDFEVGTKQVTGDYEWPIGIINFGGSGFTFDQNTFSLHVNVPNDLDGTIGIWNYNTGEDININFKNSFTGFDFANMASGKNNNNEYPELGLQYRCNQNTANKQYDFYVGWQIDEGIATVQGTSSDPAGNTFSHRTAPVGSDFKNETFRSLEYHYYTGDAYQEPINTIGLLPPKATNNPSNCNERYGVGADIRLSEAEKSGYRQQFYYNKLEYNNTKILFESLKDGGSTPSTILDIETSWPEDTWELRAQLLADSPHLSEEVLMEAASRTDVLPHTIMFEICIANPEEMRNERLLEYLAAKDDPMPQYMIDDLRDGADEDTYKGVLQNEMAGYAYEWGEACTYLLRDIVLDSTGIQYDSLRFWLTKKESLLSEYQIVNSYLAEDDLTNALAHLNDIPNNYSLSGKKLDEYNYYYDLKTTFITAQQQSRNIMQLDSLEVLDLVYIADSSLGLAGAQARSLLNFAYGYAYFEKPELTVSGMKEAKVQNKDLQNDNLNNKTHFVMAYPNPASQWVAFDYTLPYPAENATIFIADVSGRAINSMKVNRAYGQTVWDSQGVPSGIYFYSLEVNGNIIDKRKLIISK